MPADGDVARSGGQVERERSASRSRGILIERDLRRAIDRGDVRSGRNAGVGKPAGHALVGEQTRGAGHRHRRRNCRGRAGLCGRRAHAGLVADADVVPAGLIFPAEVPTKVFCKENAFADPAAARGRRCLAGGVLLSRAVSDKHVTVCGGDRAARVAADGDVVAARDSADADARRVVARAAW